MRWWALGLIGCACGGGESSGGPCEAVARPEACPGRGLYDGPVDVEMVAPEEGAAVHYTLDGSEPDAASPRYEVPVEIAPDPTTGGARILRMVALDSGGAPLGAIATHTYVFPAAVLDQPAEIPGLPGTWGSGDNVRPADYAMDRAALGGADEEAIAALAAIPTVSLVAPVEDLWDPALGIYMNPDAAGREWERAMSFEVLMPPEEQSLGFTAGVQIQGNSSTREWRSAKLSMRVAFRAEYGPGKLRYALFPDSTVAEFEHLILDAHYNFTWHHFDPEQRERASYAGDQYTARLQNATGSLAPHTRPIHLFLNGIYWGLYDLHERPDSHFAAAHLGGDPADYEVVRHNAANVVDGDGSGYAALLDAARANLMNDANLDALADRLDIDDLIDYMLINFYVGNNDWDIHNWFAIGRAGGQFRFVSWDAEHVLGDVDQDSTAMVTAGGPIEIFQALMARADMRARVAARADELYGPGGPLWVDPAAPAWSADDTDRNLPATLYVDLTDELRPSILLESARWGDNRRSAQAYTREDWDAERQRLIESYFPARSAIARQQLP